MYRFPFFDLTEIIALEVAVSEISVQNSEETQSREIKLKHVVCSVLTATSPPSESKPKASRTIGDSNLSFFSCCSRGTILESSVSVNTMMTVSDNTIDCFIHSLDLQLVDKELFVVMDLMEEFFKEKDVQGLDKPSVSCIVMNERCKGLMLFSECFS